MYHPKPKEVFKKMWKELLFFWALTIAMRIWFLGPIFHAIDVKYGGSQADLGQFIANAGTLGIMYMLWVILTYGAIAKRQREEEEVRRKNRSNYS